MNQHLKDMLLKLDVFKRFDVPQEQVDQIKPEELRRDVDSGKFFVIYDDGLTPEEIKTMLLAKQTMYIKTIKNIALFYFIISLLGAGVIVYIYFQLGAVL